MQCCPRVFILTSPIYVSLFFIFNKHNHAVHPLSAYLANLLTMNLCAPSGVSSIFIDIHQIRRSSDVANWLFFFFFCCCCCRSSCRGIKLSLRCYQQLSKSIPYSKIYFVFRKHEITQHSPCSSKFDRYLQMFIKGQLCVSHQLLKIVSGGIPRNG